MKLDGLKQALAISGILLLLTTDSHSQASSARSVLPDSTKFSGSKTKVPFDGGYLYMRIISPDSAVVDRMPTYDPEKSKQSFSSAPDSEIPQSSFRPKIVYPDDPSITSKHATVFVRTFVDSSGAVSSAEVIKSDDLALIPYALQYAKQFKFYWPDGKSTHKGTWVVLNIKFKR